MTNIILSEKPWHTTLYKNLTDRCSGEWNLIQSKKDFISSNIRKMAPTYIFVPHWSYFIPPEIYENFECIVFHMTDLPYGRGGSPLQNLIKRGHQTTKISAFRCVKGCDAGDIYLKKDLTLDGSAEEIYKRASYLIEDMICEIVQNNPAPMEQSGEVVRFVRRTPQESLIDEKFTLATLYDHIRMLDAPGYPLAFIERANLRYEFTHAKLESGELCAKVRIKEII